MFDGLFHLISPDDSSIHFIVSRSAVCGLISIQYDQIADYIGTVMYANYQSISGFDVTHLEEVLQ